MTPFTNPKYRKTHTRDAINVSEQIQPLTTSDSRECDSPHIALASMNSHSESNWTQESSILGNSGSARVVQFNNEFQSLHNYPSNNQFYIIWYDLVRKVDSRSWLAKLKDKFFREHPLARDQHLVSHLQDSTCLSGASRNKPETMKHKTILNNLCGSAEAGKLTAILGPSGAGKSSLLSCLFQNLQHGVTGSILCDGIDVNRKLKICFIPQRDYFNEYLTVREDLNYILRFRYCADLDAQHLARDVNDNSNDTDIDSKISDIADLLGITTCLDVQIRNISGGQAKRLSIARELISKPDILVLDEPTTGLDSLTSLKTIQVLKNISQVSAGKNKPIAILLVIHQPQAEVFNLFDKVYFISKYGTVIYNDCPSAVVDTLKQVANVNLPSPDYSPSSFLIEVASGELGQEVTEKLTTYVIAKFKMQYDSNKLNQLSFKYQKKTNLKSCKDIHPSDVNINKEYMQNKTENLNTSHSKQDACIHFSKNSTNLLDDVGYSNCCKVGSKYLISPQLQNTIRTNSITLRQAFEQICILVRRSTLAMFRNPKLTKSRLLFHILIPFLIASAYGSRMGGSNACPEVVEEIDFSSIQNEIQYESTTRSLEEARLTYENMGLFFILIFALTMNVSIMTSSIYPMTMQMFRKEIINGLYKPGPYFIAQTIVELPLEFFLPSISIILTYQLSGQTSSTMEWRMFCLAFGVALTCYVFHGLGLMFGSIFISNANVAMMFSQVTTIPFSVLSGFIIRPPNLSYYARLISFLSPYKLALEVCIISRYGFGICPCDEDRNMKDPVSFSGMNSRTKKVLDYMFEKNDTTGVVETSYKPSKIFEKLGDKYVKSKSFGFDIDSCDDIKPYIMSAFELDESSLKSSLVGLAIMIVIIKITTFAILRSIPYRMKN